MLSLLLGAWVVAADKSCSCNRENKGAPAKFDMDPMYGNYCKMWDKDNELCVGGDDYDVPEWCNKEWCYVDKTCEDAEPTVMYNNTVKLFWSYSACDDDNKAICMAYSKPTPKIKPCPDKDGGDKCKGKKRAQCMKTDGCKYDRDEKMCMMESEEECTDCKCKEEKPSPVTVKNNLPWGGTASPDYWYNCVSKWCSKYVWMGGMEQCHYEMKFGCGCEDMKYDQCMMDKDCCWAGEETGCQEVVECPRLTFSECLANSDKCSPCGDGACGYNCKMGPGQKLAGFQSLTLDNNCNCKVTQMF